MSINMMFFSLLITSTMIVISSPSWFCMWLGIEMNTMSFIPIMYNNKNKLTMESALKYFLIQSFASTIMFLAISMSKNDMTSIIPTSNIMLLSMSMKLGAAPFHMWYPPVAEGLMWEQNILLMTWQKIAPMVIMSMTVNWLIMIVIISSLLMGSICAFNQTSLRKLMVYSSISHMSWMMSSMMIYTKTWMMYMLIYFFTTIMTMTLMKTMNTYYIMQMHQMNNNMMILMTIGLLSMGGFPPLLGFMGKWLILNDLMQNHIIMSMMLVMSSCINLYIYIRIIHPSIHMNNMNPKIMLPYNKKSLMFSIMSIISFSPLPLMISM